MGLSMKTKVRTYRPTWTDAEGLTPMTEEDFDRDGDIRGKNEECECDFCGRLIRHGEPCRVNLVEGLIYCSRDCMAGHVEERNRHGRPSDLDGAA